MNSYEKVVEILRKYSQETIDFDVYIVADTQNNTVRDSDPRICHADESEFFSRTEFAEIASALFNVFGFARVFYSEVSFIEYFISKNIDPRGCIVYNFSRDGAKQGKKSLIPAFCDLYNLRYTGCDAFVISLLRNKHVYTRLLGSYGIAVPLSQEVYLDDDSRKSILQMFNSKEIIIKNISESASIGLSTDCRMIMTSDTYDDFCNIAKTVNKKAVLVQEFINGPECEVLVLQHNGKYTALDPVEILFPHGKEFMDSAISNDYTYNFKLFQTAEAKLLKESAEKAAKILGIKDYARLDFRLKDGIPYLFDIAGTPYTIRHSSIAYLFGQYGLRYEDIYKVIVTCMLSNYHSN